MLLGGHILEADTCHIFSYSMLWMGVTIVLYTNINIYIYIYLHIVNLDVPSDNLEFFVQPSTVIELSCESDEKMHGLTGEQKQVTSF